MSMQQIAMFKSKVNVQKILEKLSYTLNSGCLSLGNIVGEFECAMEKYLSVKHFVATCSGTSSLHMAVKLLNLPRGSRILTTPITFVSTNEAILYEGMEPVFGDVEKLTGNMDANMVSDAIKKHNVKAIMVVHIGGYSCEMDLINRLAQENGIPIIEDCAHSLGGFYNGNKIGNTKNICTWSFHATKNLTTGDGGGISVSDDKQYRRLLELRKLGINYNTQEAIEKPFPWIYDVSEVGYKYNMGDITATIGLVELDELDKNNIKRKEIANKYMDGLDDAICIKPSYTPNRISSYHLLPLFFDGRDALYKKLLENGIGSGMHYRSNTRYKCFSDFIKINDCQNAKWYEEHELTLPFHLWLTNDEIEKIISVVNLSA